MVAVTGALPEFVAVNGAIFPVPLADRPIAVLSFVQEYEVPVPLKLTATVAAPLQTTWSAGSLTVGMGLIAMDPVAEIVPQPPVSVTV